MSAWGTGPFQNDDAGDWILALADGSSDEVAMTLEVAAETEAPVGMQASCCGVAAAEVVAAARGYPCYGLPKEVKAWIQDNSFYAGRDLTVVAKKAVRKVLDDSDLAKEWAGHGGWTRRMNHLESRLSQPSKVKAPRRPKAKKKSITSKSGSDQTSASDTKARIKELRKMGASVCKSKSGDIEGVDLTCSERFTLSDLPMLLGISTMTYLALNLEFYRESDLKLLAKLPQLKELSLMSWGKPLTDGHLKQLARISKLESLELTCRADVTDASLGYLSKLSNLKLLEVATAGFTRKGLASFKKVLPECTIREPHSAYLR